MQPIQLGIGSIGVASCHKLYKRNQVEVCVYGSGLYTDCAGDCAYAVVSDPVVLVLAGRYTVSGTLVHVETGRAIAGMPVALIMPTRTRYTTRSNAKGKFKIVVNPDPRSDRRRRFKVTLDFGRMETAPEAKHITLVGDLTRTFRNAHPELKYLDLKASKFDGKTVPMRSR
ncbi:MAG TPA: hypothetical protein VH518_06045 [Tepidisphaeraceae bacterium]|jgi:hypothetical protein